VNLTRLLASATALSLAFSLSACVGDPGRPAGSETLESTAMPTAEPAPVETPIETFAMPADCTEILPPARVDALAAQGITLSGGPGSELGPYLPDPTREELAGGISCFYEDEVLPNFATFTISVAPLSPQSRPGIIADFQAQGLNETTTSAGFDVYWILGDEEDRSALHNVLTPDAWVSVVALVGGQANHDEAVVIADDVIDAVYN
jgi:hypothetical protein